MKSTKCNDCGQTFPLNETFNITDAVLCRNCAEKLVETRKDITKTQIQRQVDATVCVNCGKDNGDSELAKIGGVPACEQCIKYFRNRPYPMWIKAAMAGLAAIVIFSFAWNWRFVRAYIDIRNSKAALAVGDLKTTAKSCRSAAANVPEMRVLSAIASYHEGALMLSENKSIEALELLNSCKAELPSDWPVDEMIIDAKIYIAFDNKDYDEFLALSLQAFDINPNLPVNVAGIASAYACKYAISGDEQFKEQSLDFLKKAKTMSEQQGVLDEHEEYEDRILHRIATREIIGRDEFKKRFPDGWKQYEKEQSK